MCVAHRDCISRRLNSVFGEAQFQQRLEEGEGRFVAEVCVGAVGMKTIATSAGSRVIDREIQVIAPEEPFKSPLGFLAPTIILRNSIGLETGRHHSLTLHGLLVEEG